MKRSSLTRRSFLRRSATALGAAAAFPYVASPRVLGANGRLNIASVGVGGKGWVDLTSVDSENIVGVCDVDARRLARATEKYPQARGFADWREMFDRLGRGIDAVTVSTPDHTHFLPAHRAVREGKHVFCQKPLTHTLWEARTLTEAARRAGVATQMGNQGISHPKMRRDAELIRGGAIGDVREIHIWTDRPGTYWKQGLHRPTEFPPVPPELSWDLWLGPAPARPFLAVALAAAVPGLPWQATGLAGAAHDRLAESGVTNPVTAVLLNFRAYDTLLEIGVLLLALAAVWTVARPRHADDAEDPDGESARPQQRALLAVFLGAGRLLLGRGGRLLEYPEGAASGWILVIETAATVSIGLTLTLLFPGAGGGGRSGARARRQPLPRAACWPARAARSCTAGKQPALASSPRTASAGVRHLRQRLQ